MSNGFGPIARLELSQTDIVVGAWWTNYSGSGVSLDVTRYAKDGCVYLNWADTVLLVVALMADMSEYERSLIPEKIASLQKWLEVKDCPELKSDALAEQIGEHYREQFEAKVAALSGRTDFEGGPHG